jgi:hypothetical protein
VSGRVAQHLCHPLFRSAPRSRIASNPNRPDDEEHVVCLVAEVITVSLETQRLVSSLTPLEVGTPAA